jgi:hypothetical protein
VYYFNFATHSYFGTISKDVLSINVSRSVIIKYKSYFRISIIENAICLPAKRLIYLERFPWNDSFHFECILPNISDCPVCQATMLANVEALGRSCLLERQQILTLFAPATRFEEDKSDDECEAAEDD